MNDFLKEHPVYINGQPAKLEDIRALEQWLKMGKIRAKAYATRYGIYFETPEE